MATVSILIPAFKSEYLLKALVSAQKQTFHDIEILVGDDTPNAKLKAIVEKINDPRIRYFHHGFGNGLRNSRELWEKATGKYIKWLYDDDVLMPNSVETLVSSLFEHPESPMAFHQSVIIDENDKVILTPVAMLEAGASALIDRAFLVNHMVAHFNNFIGEPSTIMINRELIELTDILEYRSHKLSFLTDVGMYLNFAERGPLLGVGGFLSCFRQHIAQNSGIASPFFSAGIYEWELIIRSEASSRNLSLSTLNDAKRMLWEWYTDFSDRFPELLTFRENLDELVDQNIKSLLDTPHFQKNLIDAYSLVNARAKNNNQVKSA